VVVFLELDSQVDSARQDARLDGGDAEETPAGDDHGVDQVGLGAVGGLEAFDVVFAEFVELFLGFFGEHDGFGSEAVAEAVAG